MKIARVNKIDRKQKYKDELSDIYSVSPKKVYT